VTDQLYALLKPFEGDLERCWRSVCQRVDYDISISVHHDLGVSPLMLETLYHRLTSYVTLMQQSVPHPRTVFVHLFQRLRFNNVSDQQRRTTSSFHDAASLRALTSRVQHDLYEALIAVGIFSSFIY